MYARSTASSVGFGGVRGETSGSARRSVTALGQRVGDRSLGTGRQDDRALERVLELAHVAGPRVRLHGRRARRRAGA